MNKYHFILHALKQTIQVRSPAHSPFKRPLTPQTGDDDDDEEDDDDDASADKKRKSKKKKKNVDDDLGGTATAASATATSDHDQGNPRRATPSVNNEFRAGVGFIQCRMSLLGVEQIDLGVDRTSI